MSITRAQEHRRAAVALIDQAEELRAKIPKRNGKNLTAEEARSFDAKMAEAEREIEAAERLEADVAAEKRAAIRERADSEGEGGGGRLTIELRDGRRLRAFGPDESIAAALPELRSNRVVPDLGGGAEQDQDLPSFGALLRASAFGARTPAEARALSSSSIASGGILIPPALAAAVVDDTRRASRIISAGAGTLPIPEGGSMTIARIVGDLTPSWRGESAAVAESEPSFAGHVISAHTLAVQCSAPVELLEDASGMDSQLRALFAEAFAGELDRCGIVGSNVGEPGGLLSYTNGELAHPIPTVDMGENGAALTSYNPLIDGQYEIAAINGPPPNVAIMHPRTDRDFAKLVTTGDGADGQPLRRPDALTALRFATSTRVGIADVHGSATDASRIYLGGWGQLLYCMRTELQIMALREIKMASNLEVVFVGYLRADVAVLRTNHFAIVEGIIPPT
jgi:HK97 family phage major capsid protein